MHVHLNQVCANQVSCALSSNTIRHRRAASNRSMRALQRSLNNAFFTAFLLWIVMVVQQIESGEAGKSRRAEQGRDPDQRIHEIRRAPKPEFDASKGVTKYELHYARTNRETHEHTTFSYTTVRNDNLFISLDDLEGVHDIDCSESDILKITVSDSCTLLNNMHSWTSVSGNGFLVYGGYEWGCLDPSGGGRSPLFRVMTGRRTANRTDDGNFTVSIPTDSASPFEFFGRTQFSFTSNESLLDMGGLRKVLHELSTQHDSPTSRARRTIYGPFPSDGSEWGYGTSIDLINWNYNAIAGQSVEDSCFAGSPDEFENGLRACCKDCYVYAGAGIGFEFETQAFDYYPTYLIYMKLWVGAVATYSVNLDLEAEHASSRFSNVLLQTGDRDVDFRSSSFNGGGAPNLLRNDLYFNVAGITININFKLPVFLQWGLTTSGAGRAWAGSHYRASEEYGIAYLDQDHKHECVMSGCQALGQSCYDTWCYVSESTYESGSSGPYWTFKGPVQAQVKLTPIFIIRVWGGLVSGLFQLDAVATVTGTVNQRRGFPARAADQPLALEKKAEENFEVLAKERAVAQRSRLATKTDDSEVTQDGDLDQTDGWVTPPDSWDYYGEEEKLDYYGEEEKLEAGDRRASVVYNGACDPFSWSSGEGKFCCNYGEDCSYCGGGYFYGCESCYTATCSCDSCPDGYWRSDCQGSSQGYCTQCAACPAGSSRVGCSGTSSGYCEVCPACGPDTYSDGSCGCQACPPGTDTRGAGGAEGVEACVCQNPDFYPDYSQSSPCVGLSSSQCLQVTVEGSLHAYAWARAALSLNFLNSGYDMEIFSFASSVFELGSLGPWELIDPVCIQLADVSEPSGRKIPMTASLPLSAAESAFIQIGPVASLKVQKGAVQTPETIEASLVTDEQSEMSVAEAAKYDLQSRMLRLEPHGMTFNEDVQIRMDVNTSKWDPSVTTAEEFCANLVVISKPDNSLPWTALTSTTLDCSSLPTIVIPTRTFSYYAISATTSEASAASTTVHVASSSSTDSQTTTSSSTTSTFSTSPSSSTTTPSISLTFSASASAYSSTTAPSTSEYSSSSTTTSSSSSSPSSPSSPTTPTPCTSSTSTVTTSPTPSRATSSSFTTTSTPTPSTSSSSTTTTPTQAPSTSSSTTTSTPTPSTSSSSTTTTTPTPSTSSTSTTTPTPSTSSTPTPSTSSSSTTTTTPTPSTSSSTTTTSTPSTSSSSTTTTSPTPSTSSSSTTSTPTSTSSSSTTTIHAASSSISMPSTSVTATTTPTPFVTATTSSTMKPPPPTTSSRIPTSASSTSTHSSTTISTTTNTAAITTTTTAIPTFFTTTSTRPASTTPNDPTTTSSSFSSATSGTTVTSVTEAPPTAVNEEMSFSVEATVSFVGNVSDFDEASFQKAVSSAAGVDTSRVRVNAVRAVPAARRKDSMIEIDFAILYPSSESAQAGAAQLTEETLNQEFQAVGLPTAALVTPLRVVDRFVPETTPAPPTEQDEDSDSGPPVALIVGLTCGIGTLLLAAGVGYYYLRVMSNVKSNTSRKDSLSKPEPESGGEIGPYASGEVVNLIPNEKLTTDWEHSNEPGVVRFPAPAAPSLDWQAQHIWNVDTFASASAAPAADLRGQMMLPSGSGWMTPQPPSLTSSWMLPGPFWPAAGSAVPPIAPMAIQYPASAPVLWDVQAAMVVSQLPTAQVHYAPDQWRHVPLFGMPLWEQAGTSVGPQALPQVF